MNELENDKRYNVTFRIKCEIITLLALHINTWFCMQTGKSLE